MFSFDLKRTTAVGVTLVLAVGVLTVNGYIFPTHRALARQQAVRLGFVDQLRKQFSQTDQHKWQIYTEGELDSTLVCVCANCDSPEAASYANTDSELANNARRLDFKYLVIQDENSKRTTMNLRLIHLKKIFGIGRLQPRGRPSNKSLDASRDGVFSPEACFEFKVGATAPPGQRRRLAPFVLED